MRWTPRQPVNQVNFHSDRSNPCCHHYFLVASILKSLRDNLHDPAPDDQLDADPYLTCFGQWRHGPQELPAEVAQFCPGSPDNLITMSTGYPYYGIRLY